MRTVLKLLALTASLTAGIGPAVAAPPCSSEVSAAFDKLRQLPSFNMETRIDNEQGTLNMSVDYVLPDRMHQRVAMGEGSPVEMIVIGQRAWSNQGQGWAELPEKFADQVSQQMKATVVQRQPDSTDYTCLGETEFEGKRYLAYRASLPSVPTRENPTPKSADTAGPGNIQMVYVDKSTGLPVRNIVTAANVPDKKLFDGTFNMRTGLKIEEPKTSAR